MIKIFLVTSIVLVWQKALAFVPQRCTIRRNKEAKILDHNFLNTQLQIRGGASTRIDLSLPLSPAAASLVAGSLAGAIGVGIAFPLDTLKTKSQVLSKQTQFFNNGSQLNISQMSMLQLMSFIYSEEGLGGFFGGVKAMMLGQGNFYSQFIVSF